MNESERSANSADCSERPTASPFDTVLYVLYSLDSEMLRPSPGGADGKPPQHIWRLELVPKQLVIATMFATCCWLSSPKGLSAVHAQSSNEAGSPADSQPSEEALCPEEEPCPDEASCVEKAPCPKVYEKCTELRKDWPLGVHRDGKTYLKSWDRAEKLTYRLNPRRDGDKDDYACETDQGVKRQSYVVWGVGISAPVYAQHDLASAVTDAGGVVRATGFRNELRPAIVAAYLFRPREGRPRHGVVGLVDAEVFGDDGFADPRGLGVGYMRVFRSSDAPTGNWSNAFGLGVAVMYNTGAKQLRDDFDLNEMAPAVGGKSLAPVLVDTNSYSLTVVLTYSFGKVREANKED